MLEQVGPRIAVTYRYPGKLQPYVDALRLAGLEPMPVRPGESAEPGPVRGLLLTGGTDVDPILYGRLPADAQDCPDRERDEMEAGLLRHALASGIPVLAICRGLQLWNVVAGGTLHQHIDGHKGAGVHPVQVATGTRLHALLGDEVTVNSRHHQAIDRLGEKLVVSATAHDGVIEAVEYAPHPFAIAVQWHPEDLIDTHAHARALFEAFGAATIS